MTLPLSEKLFLSLREFHALGGPCVVTCYALETAGKLQILRPAHGKTGVTRDEALRYLSTPARERGDSAKAWTASVAARKARRAAA